MSRQSVARCRRPRADKPQDEPYKTIVPTGFGVAIRIHGNVTRTLLSRMNQTKMDGSQMCVGTPSLSLSILKLIKTARLPLLLFPVLEYGRSHEHTHTHLHTPKQVCECALSLSHRISFPLYLSSHSLSLSLYTEYFINSSLHVS